MSDWTVVRRAGRRRRRRSPSAGGHRAYERSGDRRSPAPSRPHGPRGYGGPEGPWDRAYSPARPLDPRYPRSWSGVRRSPAPSRPYAPRDFGGPAGPRGRSGWDPPARQHRGPRPHTPPMTGRRQYNHRDQRPRSPPGNPRPTTGSRGYARREVHDRTARAPPLPHRRGYSPVLNRRFSVSSLVAQPWPKSVHRSQLTANKRQNYN